MPKLSLKKAAAYRYSAVKRHHDEGAIEVDPGAPVSCANPEEGAYVQAWVWIPADQMERDAQSLKDEDANKKEAARPWGDD